MLMIIWMMKKGDSRSNPFSRPFLCCSSREDSPPMPERLVGADGQTALLHGHLRGGHGVLGEQVHPAHFALVDVLLGHEVLHFTRKARVELGDIEAGDGRDARLAGEHRLPVLLGTGAQCRDQPGTGDDDSTV
jgi:hypothetical protein